MELSTTTREYMEALNAKFSSMDYKITGVPGRKFDRLMTTSPLETSPSHIHAFVERETGFLYKPAGLKSPAAGARYDLSTPDSLFSTVKTADPFGRYLYKSR